MGCYQNTKQRWHLGKSMSNKLFRIEIIQPQFDEIYTKFQNACDINSWANTGQDKMLQNLQAGKDINENVSEFLEVELPQYNNKEDKKEKPIIATFKRPPIIKPKTLELIAQEIGNLDTGTNLINCQSLELSVPVFWALLLEGV